MTKIILTHLANLQNESTAVSEVNANSDTIVSSFDNTLSRDGTTPNQMMNNLDMNSNQIYNLPSPGSATSPARLQDVTGSVIISSVPPVGTSGAVVGYLNGNNTYSGNDVFSGNNTFTGTNTFTNVAPITVGANSGNNGLVNFKGSTSGTTIIQANTAASGTLTLPTATDTLIGKATTDTLTNKTYDTAGTGNVFKINGTGISAITGSGSVVLATSPTITTPNISGVTDASSATSGKVGEYIESIIAAGAAASTSTSGTAQNITSIALTAGDWDVSGEVSYISSSITNVFHAAQISISTTSTTHNLVSTAFTNHSFGSMIAIALDNPYSASGVETLKTGNYRVNINTPATVYLVSTLNWTTSTQPTAYGAIRARRVR